MNLYRTLIVGCALLLLLPLSVPAQPDPGMELILLGTGYPYPFADKAGPSCAVVVGDRTFIVDAGRGVGMRLAAADLAWDSIEAAFITHLHSDHIDGLPDLFHSTWQFGAGRPFELYGPGGIQQVADAMRLFYEADIHIRRDLTEKLPPEGARINVHPVTDGGVYNFTGGIRVTAFSVDHHPVEPAFGFRFDFGEQSIVVSGDTAPNTNLVRFSMGVDILVHEAFVRTNAFNREESHPWTIYDYHSSAREAGEAAKQAGVRFLVLTHLIPGDAPEELFLEEAAKAFDGKIVVGKDLVRIKIPVRSDTVPGQ